MRLRCIGKYENGPKQLAFMPGQEFYATSEQARYLLADAPGCFEEVLPAPLPTVPDQDKEPEQGDQGDEQLDEQKNVDRPPMDKAVRMAARRK